jgi:FkbM family methyltransferase
MTHHTVGSFILALRRRPFWVAGVNILTRFRSPAAVFSRYVFGTGTYPESFTVRTPLGERRVTAYTYHDLLTLVECFGKVDYRVPRSITTVVDVGANIGISALYFLTRSPEVRVDLYEPVAENRDRLKLTLDGLEDRYVVHTEAVGVTPGTASFAVEPTGRYGGLVTDRYVAGHGLAGARQVEVPVVGVNDVVSAAADRWGTVDLLKLDVEWMEDELIQALTPASLSHLGRIYAETDFAGDLPGFRRTSYGGVVRFRRIGR